jgi:hypothetical protein
LASCTRRAIRGHADKDEPNQLLQPTGHANEVLSSYSAFSGVSRQFLSAVHIHTGNLAVPCSPWCAASAIPSPVVAKAESSL